MFFMYFRYRRFYRIIRMRKGSQTGHEFCALNHSPSKMSYSFTKEHRFRIPKLEKYTIMLYSPNSNFYNISGKLNTRSAGFGYGNKSNIILP